MKKVYIKAISYHLPEKILSNSDLETLFPDWSATKISEKVGIRERHISSEGECASDLAVNAAEKLFREYDIDRNTIDFVLFCTQSPDYVLPTTACLIQHRLGLATGVGALDYNLGCSGFPYGLALAKGLIVAGMATQVLLLTGDTYSKYIDPNDRGNRTLFGDGATASLISTEGFCTIEEFSFGTDGSGAKNLIVETGGNRGSRGTREANSLTSSDQAPVDHLFMNGSEIFSFTLSSVPLLVKDVLSKNALDLSNVDLFIFHQANKHMLNFIRQKIGIPEDKFVVYLESVGNTVSSTIPIALYETQKQGRLFGNILLAGFGVGYSWGGVVLKCVEK